LATSGDGTNNFSYGYDRWGNRWNQTVTKGSGPQPSYSFNTNNQSGSFTYDAAGNITNDGAHTYSYDAEGRVLTVDGGSTDTYVYNSRGMRAAIVGSEFLFDLSGNIVSAVTPGTTTLLYNRYTVGGRLLAANASSSTYFYHQDWLGGIRLTTNLNGTSDGTCTNLPFGDSPSCNSWYFAGLMYDSWDNLNTSATRSESPTSGRWLTPDPAGLASVDPSNPQTWNRYAYVTNNPVSFVDPKGLYLAPPGGGGPCLACNGSGDNGGWFGNCAVDGAGGFCGALDSLELVACPDNICNGLTNGGQYFQFVAGAGGTQGYILMSNILQGINEANGTFYSDKQYQSYMAQAHPTQIAGQYKRLTDNMANIGMPGTVDANNYLINGAHADFAFNCPDGDSCGENRYPDGIHVTADPSGQLWIHDDTVSPWISPFSFSNFDLGNFLYHGVQDLLGGSLCNCVFSQ
jgi:RHS repeat-associated protein